MEQTNLENQIKNKLNQRSIPPAAASWDRLDAMLSIAEPGESELVKPKRNWGWMYIAASFLGFLLITTVYFSQTETMIDAGKIPSGVSKNQLVVNQTKMVETKTRLVVNQNQLVVYKNQLSESKTRLANESIINQKNNPIAVDLKSSESQNPEAKSNTSETTKPKYIASNVLLASVQPATDLEKPIRKSDLKIDPKSLLSEVEGELNQTFRETTLERLSRNFKTIRTAVANRNKE